MNGEASERAAGCLRWERLCRWTRFSAGNIKCNGTITIISTIMTDIATVTLVYHTVTGGNPYYKLLHFGHEDDKRFWKNHVLLIKKEMAAINHCRDSQPETWIIFRLQRWLRHVQEDLIDEFGVAHVPLDIRKTTNSVKEQLEEPLTDFGPDFGEIDKTALSG